MIITLIAIPLFLISLIILLVSKIKNDKDWDDLIGRIILVAVMGIFFIIVVASLLVDPILHRSEIAEFNSVQESLNLSRSNPNVNQFELVAIQQKVIGKNEWLANAQFWARHKLTNWFWPKEILELTPIK